MSARTTRYLVVSSDQGDLSFAAAKRRLYDCNEDIIELVWETSDDPEDDPYVLVSARVSSPSEPTPAVFDEKGAWDAVAALSDDAFDAWCDTAAGEPTPEAEG